MSDIDRPIAAWDRPDRVGLLANIALFVGTTIVLNGIIFAFGIDRRADALTRLSWAPGFDLQLGAWLNVVTALFTILLLWRVWRDSRTAFGWLLPSLIWVCFATVLTFVALQAVE